MATMNLKELKYESQLVLVEVARKALQAKADAAGNVITATYATKQEVEALKAIHFEVVDELPETGEPNIIYLVPKTDSKTGNTKDEWIWIVPASGAGYWEKIGSTDIDLSEYRKAAAQDIIDNQIKDRIAVFETGGAHDVAALEVRVGTAESDIAALETALADIYKKSEVDALLDEKVDKEEGKSLVDDEEIAKLATVSEGANKVEASSTNGKIKIDGVDTTVYTSSVSATDVSIDW